MQSCLLFGCICCVLLSKLCQQFPWTSLSGHLKESWYSIWSAEVKCLDVPCISFRVDRFDVFQNLSLIFNNPKSFDSCIELDLVEIFPVYLHNKLEDFYKLFGDLVDDAVSGLNDEPKYRRTGGRNCAIYNTIIRPNFVGRIKSTNFSTDGTLLEEEYISQGYNECNVWSKKKLFTNDHVYSYMTSMAWDNWRGFFRLDTSVFNNLYCCAKQFYNRICLSICLPVTSYVSSMPIWRVHFIFGTNSTHGMTMCHTPFSGKKSKVKLIDIYLKNIDFGS